MFSHNLSAPLSYVCDSFDMQLILPRCLKASHHTFRQYQRLTEFVVNIMHLEQHMTSAVTLPA